MSTADGLTSQEDRFREADDEALRNRAASLGRLLLTQDGDFLAMIPYWRQSDRDLPGVFFARQGLPIGRMADEPELCLACCSADR